MNTDNTKPSEILIQRLDREHERIEKLQETLRKKDEEIESLRTELNDVIRVATNDMAEVGLSTQSSSILYPPASMLGGQDLYRRHG